MAQVSVPSIETVIPTTADKVVGVQSGAVKLFNVSNFSAIVGGASATAQSADLNTANFYTAPVDGLYRVSGFLVVSRAATTSSQLPGCTVAYTEPITGEAITSTVTASANTNTVGLHTSGTAVVQMRANTGLTLTTSDYQSVGATSMQYAVRLTVERIS